MRNRKPFLICLPLLFLATFCLSPTVSAAECGGVDTIILSCEGEAKDSIFEILQLIVDIMSIGVGILAVIGITITGIQWITSGGNEQTATKAKRRFFEIIVGVAIYATAFLLLEWAYIAPNRERSSGQSSTNTSQSGTASRAQPSSNNSTTPTSANQTGASPSNSDNTASNNNSNSGSSSNNNRRNTSPSNGPRYMGVPLAHYSNLRGITADMLVERADTIMNYAQNNGWTYGDSHGTPPGSDKLISCDRLIDIDLYTLGFTLQPAGGHTTGMFPWLRRLGFKESHSLSAIKRGSIVWLKYMGGTSEGHMFITSDWNRSTGKFIRYDAGRNWNHPQPIVTNGFPYRIVDNNYDAYLKVFNLP